MTIPRKSTKVRRVRKMWASEPPGLSFEVYRTKQEADNYGDYPGENFPVAVVPLTPTDIERHLERAADAAMAWERNRYGRLGNANSDTYRMQARAVLTAIFGRLPSPAPGAKGKRK